MLTNDFKVEELSWEQASFDYSTSVVKECRQISYDATIIGQPRALRALAMGLSIKQNGYNVFVSGDSGSGRLTTVRRIAQQFRGDVSILRDIVYTYNFIEPDSPNVLLFKAGEGLRFTDGMDHFSQLLDSDKNQAMAYLSTMETQFPESDCRLFFSHVRSDIQRQALQSEKYKVKLLVNHAGSTERPFVVETHPSFTNLFGSVDKEYKFAHLALHAGSLLRSSGGFLIINAEQIIDEKGLWIALKRYLYAVEDSKNPIGELLSPPVRPALAAMPLKVVLIGSEDVYDTLSEKDEQFLSLFKISAQFDYSMVANSENISKTIALLDHYTLENHLLPLTDDALAQMLRYSAWFAEMRNELTTQFSQLCDILVEADYWARLENKNCIDKSMILKANEERTYFSGITEERINKEILDGEMVISLKGDRIGVVNGLAVMDRGSSSFGTPTVISATVAPGNEGIVNIEHEAGLSGEIHDKGLLILQGYLRKHYARNFPLSIYAGIAFEQNYSEIDGDSASSSELYALLSAIGELPIRQDVAVTGSVNQMGMVQPVGGINEKIEGFYTTCRATGLTGHQAVIIPYQNTKNLILPYEVLDDIKAKRFHIYPVKTIDEGMQILTNRPAGKRNEKGNFPPDSLNRLIEERLKKMYLAGQSKT
ncbi:MAG: AAA family ATPase [Sphaerochaetaceae bacterium]